jgi:hypothetical protein
VAVMMGHDDVAQLTWTNHQSDTWHVWLDVKVPRGPITGCHVAPRVLPMRAMSKILVSPGIEPATSSTCNAFASLRPTRPRGGACYVNGALLYLSLFVFETAGGRAGA